MTVFDRSGFDNDLESSPMNPASTYDRHRPLAGFNVISLARSRYGAAWPSKVSPEEAANCGDEIRRLSQ